MSTPAPCPDPSRLPGASVPLPASVREYLTHPSLTTMWQQVRASLQKNALQVAGAVTVQLDEEAAARLRGLTGTRVKWAPGSRRVKLAVLDEALRGSAAGRGLLEVVADLTGSALVDQGAVKAEDLRRRAAVTDQLSAALDQAGLGAEPWTSSFLARTRRDGLLTRAGAQAPALVASFGAVVVDLTTRGHLRGAPDPAGLGAGERVALGELASRCTGDAHGLDDSLLSRLVLRCVAAALDVDVPGTAAGRRELWSAVGVEPDQVSGTVLTWEFRPTGSSPWARMMHARADLGLVTHLTLQELVVLGPALGEELRTSGPVWACENPQVLQAVAAAGTPAALVCTSGNPSGAAWRLLTSLLEAGVEVRYHGDFDWPGVSMAARLVDRGARPWRMSSGDYRAAVAAALRRGTGTLQLSGRAHDTGWDPGLRRAMEELRIAVHEEALTEELAGDLG